MKRYCGRILRWTRACLGCAVLGLAMPAPAAEPGKPSMFDSIGAGFKKGVDGVTSFFTPKPADEPAQDPLSLSTKSKGGPDVQVAMARHQAAMARQQEQNGRKQEAAAGYQQALKMAPKDPQVQGAYGAYKARLGELDEAIRIYQQAAKLGPDDPGLANDLGLCLARRGRHEEAVAAIGRAAQLQPNNPLYRNNMATIMVEAGQPDEALQQLRAVHSEAVAQYNVGYLLHKKGQSVAAAQHFAMALQRDPSLEAARYWLDRISAHPGEQSAFKPWPAVPSGQSARPQGAGPMAGVAPAAGPIGAGVAGPPPAMATETAPLPPPLPGSNRWNAAAPPPADSYCPDPRAPLPAADRRGSGEYPIRRQGFVEETDEPAKTRRLPPTRLPQPD